MAVHFGVPSPSASRQVKPARPWRQPASPGIIGSLLQRAPRRRTPSRTKPCTQDPTCCSSPISSTSRTGTCANCSKRSPGTPACARGALPATGSPTTTRRSTTPPRHCRPGPNGLASACSRSLASLPTTACSTSTKTASHPWAFIPMSARCWKPAPGWPSSPSRTPARSASAARPTASTKWPGRYRPARCSTWTRPSRPTGCTPFPGPKPPARASASPSAACGQRLQAGGPADGC